MQNENDKLNNKQKQLSNKKIQNANPGFKKYDVSEIHDDMELSIDPETLKIIEEDLRSFKDKLSKREFADLRESLLEYANQREKDKVKKSNLNNNESSAESKALIKRSKYEDAQFKLLWHFTAIIIIYGLADICSSFFDDTRWCRIIFESALCILFVVWSYYFTQIKLLKEYKDCEKIKIDLSNPKEHPGMFKHIMYFCIFGLLIGGFIWLEFATDFKMLHFIVLGLTEG